jgi:hypothetical protein
MAQADQTVQNATFPTVRADINNNLAALFSANSGNTAPSVTVAFQDWIDTSGANPLWKKRNAANNAWITLGTISGNAIAFEGTLPSQSGNAGKYLGTNGTVASWLTLAVGASMQVFTNSGTFTPTAGKTSFLVMATGGGGGSGGAYQNGYSGGGGGSGTAIRMYTSVEMGGSSAVTVGGGGGGGLSGIFGVRFAGPGSAGGDSIVDPDGSGLTITGGGGGGGGAGNSAAGGGGGGGSTTNSQFDIAGQQAIGSVNVAVANSTAGGPSFWMGGRGRGANGVYGGGGNNGAYGITGTAGVVVILEF